MVILRRSHRVMSWCVSEIVVRNENESKRTSERELQLQAQYNIITRHCTENICWNNSLSRQSNPKSNSLSHLIVIYCTFCKIFILISSAIHCDFGLSLSRCLCLFVFCISVILVRLQGAHTFMLHAKSSYVLIILQSEKRTKHKTTAHKTIFLSFFLSFFLVVVVV